MTPTKTDVIHAALALLGQSTDVRSHERRRRLLERYLRSSSVWVRYGAILGLDSLNDPKSVAGLHAAARAETDKMLKGLLAKVVTRLMGLQRH